MNETPNGRAAQSWINTVLALAALATTLYLALSGRSAEQVLAFQALHEQVAVMRSQVDVLLAANLQRAQDASVIFHRPEARFVRRDSLLSAWGKHALADADRDELAGLLSGVVNDKTEQDSARTMAAEILRSLEQQHRDQPGEPKSVR